MTVGVSLHRYVGVCLPFRAVEILRPRRVAILIASMIGFSVLFNTTKFFEVRVVNDCYRTNIDAMLPVSYKLKDMVFAYNCGDDHGNGNGTCNR